MRRNAPHTTCGATAQPALGARAIRQDPNSPPLLLSSPACVCVPRLIGCVAVALSLSLLGTSPPLEAQGATGTYYANLVARAETIVAKAYKSQVQINGDSEQNPNAYVTYDATEDAAKVEYVNDNVGDGSLPNQVRPRLPSIVTSGNLLFYAEFKWHAHWADVSYRAGVNTLKWLQHYGSTGNCGTLGCKHRYEPRMLFTSATAGNVAKRDTRAYTAANNSLSIGGGANFQVAPTQWYRWWSYLEFVDGDTIRYSEWMAAGTGTPVQLVNLFQGDFNGGLAAGVDQFWFEYNTSQPRPATAGPLRAWFRNFAVLRNVSNPGAIVGGSTPPPPGPAPPSSVRLF